MMRFSKFLNKFLELCGITGLIGIPMNIVAIIVIFSEHHKNIDNIWFKADEDTLIGRVVWLIPILILILFIVVIKYIIKKYLLKYLYKSRDITDKEYDKLKKSSIDSALYICIWFVMSITYFLTLLIHNIRTNHIEISFVLLPSCLLMVSTYFYSHKH